MAMPPQLAAAIKGKAPAAGKPSKGIQSAAQSVMASKAAPKKGGLPPWLMKK